MFYQITYCLNTRRSTYFNFVSMEKNYIVVFFVMIIIVSLQLLFFLNFCGCVVKLQILMSKCFKFDLFVIKKYAYGLFIYSEKSISVKCISNWKLLRLLQSFEIYSKLVKNNLCFGF